MATPRLISRNSPIILGLIRSGLHRGYASLPHAYSEKDPAPYFFSQSVQNLLYYLTRPTFAKIFRKRTNQGDKWLSPPEYKFMTDEELQAEIQKARDKAKYLLQMPPVVKLQKFEEKFIDKEPKITEHDQSKYIFTDITYGLKYNDRMIVVREPDGTLKYTDPDVKKRMVQTYFPMEGRLLREPLMFSDDSLFNRLLEAKKYEFVLDRACIQYDPMENNYQKVVTRVYRHCDADLSFELLRSTRHFGPMAFYFAWNNAIDSLLLEMLKTGHAREATALINLHHNLHDIDAAESKPIIEQILKQTILPYENTNQPLTDANVEIEDRCIACIQNYIDTTSTRKAQHELALQSYRETLSQRIKLEQGIKQAHGAV